MVSVDSGWVIGANVGTGRVMAWLDNIEVEIPVTVGAPAPEITDEPPLTKPGCAAKSTYDEEMLALIESGLATQKEMSAVVLEERTRRLGPSTHALNANELDEPSLVHALFWVCANLADTRSLCLVLDDAVEPGGVERADGHTRVGEREQRHDRKRHNCMKRVLHFE